MNDYAVKPCPFCGSPACWPITTGQSLTVVCCAECHAEGPMAINDEDAVRLWNERGNVPVASAGERQCAKVRIAVTVDAAGNWNADTWGFANGELGRHDHEAAAMIGLPEDQEGNSHVVWVTASVPLPCSDVVGEVEETT